MKQYRIGVVGYGWAAEAHIAAINACPQAEVAYLCSSRSLDEKELSEKHRTPLRVFNDYAALLAEPDLDAVSICSYHHQHPAQIIAAARAGKHIIAEKPLALNLEDLRAIEKAVRQAGVVFTVCFELRFSKQFRTIKSLIDQGRLGTIHYGEVDYYHGIGPWYREYQWCTTNAGCGSSLLAAGCHALDALLLCMGGEVEEVVARGTGSQNEVFRKYEYPSTSVTLLTFADGRVGKCASVIDCYQPYYFHTHLVGSEGSLLDNKFRSNLDGSDKDQWNPLAFAPVDSGDVADHPYQTQFEAFFNAIQAGRPMPLTGLKEAVLTHEVIFAAERALRERRPVRLGEIRG